MFNLLNINLKGFIKLGFVLVVLFAFIACNKTDKEAEQLEVDKKLISDYVTQKSLIGQFTDSGLWYQVINQGGGVQAYKTATVNVIYSGYLLNGTPFDESPTTGSTFSLNSVIEGWTEGIPKLKEGGNGKLIIPSKLGYGTKVVGDIPENSVLIFDVELLDVL